MGPSSFPFSRHLPKNMFWCPNFHGEAKLIADLHKIYTDPNSNQWGLRSALSATRKDDEAASEPSRLRNLAFAT